MSEWRSINLSEVVWDTVKGRCRASLELARQSRPSRIDESDVRWSQMTLGDLANIGEKAWRNVPGIGNTAVSLIKDTIDAAANGVVIIKQAVAQDAYVPRCERVDKPNAQE